MAVANNNHTLTNEQTDRYNRQLLLPELGSEGQQKLLNSTVLVVGAGGLGCPVLQYLAAAGVGSIGIIDNDVVSLSNLHRQILFGTGDVGKSKAQVASQKIQYLNPGIQVNVYDHRLTPGNAWDILSKYDLVIDGSDNFGTRYLVNDACVLLHKPLVYGSIFRFEGQLSVFNYQSPINYRDLYPTQPLPGEVPNCAEAGVLGVLPGIIGCLMANEAIKIITGMGDVLSGKLLTYHTLHNRFFDFSLGHILAANKAPANRMAFEAHDYGYECSLAPQSDIIDHVAFEVYLQQTGTQVIDVREKGEQPLINEFDHLQIPLSRIRTEAFEVSGDPIILVCQSGVRSVEAARLMALTNPTKNIVTLKGGITAWKTNRQQATP